MAGSGCVIRCCTSRLRLRRSVSCCIPPAESTGRFRLPRQVPCDRMKRGSLFAMLSAGECPRLLLLEPGSPVPFPSTTILSVSQQFMCTLDLFIGRGFHASGWSSTLRLPPASMPAVGAKPSSISNHCRNPKHRPRHQGSRMGGHYSFCSGHAGAALERSVQANGVGWTDPCRRPTNVFHRLLHRSYSHGYPQGVRDYSHAFPAHQGAAPGSLNTLVWPPTLRLHRATWIGHPATPSIDQEKASSSSSI